MQGISIEELEKIKIPPQSGGESEKDSSTQSEGGDVEKETSPRSGGEVDALEFTPMGEAKGKKATEKDALEVPPKKGVKKINAEKSAKAFVSFYAFGVGQICSALSGEAAENYTLTKVKKMELEEVTKDFFELEQIGLSPKALFFSMILTISATMIVPAYREGRAKKKAAQKDSSPQPTKKAAIKKAAKIVELPPPEKEKTAGAIENPYKKQVQSFNLTGSKKTVKEATEREGKPRPNYEYYTDNITRNGVTHPVKGFYHCDENNSRLTYEEIPEKGAKPSQYILELIESLKASKGWDFTANKKEINKYIRNHLKNLPNE